MSKERLLRETGKGLLRAGWRLKVEDSLNHLAEIHSFLENDKGNLLLYGNHIAFDDPVAAALFYTRYIDPKGNRHLIIPASHWHTDSKNSRPFYIATKLAEIFFGAEIYRIIQGYMVGDPQYGYTKEEAWESYRLFLTRLRELRKNNEPITLLIYPEGHRSETGKLQNIEEGLIHAGKIMQPTVYVPLAIYYKTPYIRTGGLMNSRLTGHCPYLSVGEPFFQVGNETPSAAQLMHNLAQSLPPQMRGPY